MFYSLDLKIYDFGINSLGASGTDSQSVSTKPSSVNNPSTPDKGLLGITLTLHSISEISRLQ